MTQAAAVRSGLGEAAEDYIKAIYKLSAGGGSVTSAAVAVRLGVTPPAVTKMAKRLRRRGLIDSSGTAGLQLTPEGERTALRLLRSHRLIELFLTKELGLPWEEVHQEAEKLEHSISERVEARIAELLGHPTHDPHGQPIPSPDGDLNDAEAIPLLQLAPGGSAVVTRVAATVPGMLRHLGELGVFPGTRVEMLEPDPYGGSLRLKVTGTERAIGRELAAHVFITMEVGEQ